MKKLTSIVLVLVLMVAAAVPAFAAVPETVAPLYINTSQASIGLAFSDDGVASVAIRCTGKSSATGIDAEVYLERKVGSAWIRVTLDNGANSWTESVTTRYANGDSLRYVYDELANVSEVWYADSDPSTEDQKIYAYSYNAYGQLYRFDNLVSKQSIIYE